MASFRTGEGISLEFIGEQHKDSEEIVLEATRQNAEEMRFATERLKNDREFALIAIQNNPKTINYMNPDFKLDKELV